MTGRQAYPIPTRVIIIEDMPEGVNFIDVNGIRLIGRGTDIIAYYKAQPTHIQVNGHEDISFMEFEKWLRIQEEDT